MFNKLSLHFPKSAMILGLSLCSSVATAAILDPNSSITLSGTTATSNPNLAGSVVYQNQIGFSVTDDGGNTLLTGNYIDTVIRSNNTNSLIFSGRIQDLAYVGENDLGIYDWSVTGYSGYQTDVDYRTDLIDPDTGAAYTGEGPNLATRTTDGDLLTFDFETELSPPDSSLFSSVATDAGLFDQSGMVFFGIEDFINDEDYLVEISGIAAPSPVPLPAAFWMFGSGLIGLIGFQRKRRNG
ncbi:MAG: VPLPA-CTERM sorting domain-containing protein [Candidatus Thiodiazotropha sp.]